MGKLILGNYVLILLGFVLIGSGPYIVYKTITGVLNRRRENPDEKLHPISNGINVIIGILFLWAGVLFVINNLRGNPFSGL